VIRRVLLAGIVAGLIAGTVGFAIQALKVIPLIREAETFEGTAKPQSHPKGIPTGTVVLAAASWRQPLVETGLTLAANLLTGAGFGLFLAGAITFSSRNPTLVEGLIWGFAGFTVFTLAPCQVLPPHLPGMAESDLTTRQFWWLGTAAATGAGLGLIAFTGRWPTRALGLALLALPFLVDPLIPSGPTEGTGMGVQLPAALVASFVAASMTASATFWIVLGVTTSMILDRYSTVEAP